MPQMTAQRESTRPGRVVLVGAGPGAADLITLRGAKALREAEVVLYDDLANEELLTLCAPATEKIYVGKRLGSHSATQARICALLIEKASEGRLVVRLKGGDPMVFGRVGEELAALTEAGIAWEIVPGVTAAIAAGAATGVPLTHRDYSSAVVFVTGHECAKSQGRVDWAALAKSRATLCIYMGVKRLPEISTALIEGGLTDTTPVQIVTNATLPTQSVRRTTLAEVAVFASQLAGQPALIIVGEVVRLADVLAQAAQMAVPA